MASIVVDSSVTVKWINQINEELLDQADKLLADTQAGSISLLAPELSKYEIGNALLNKKLDLSKAYQSLGTVYQLPITFVPETKELANQTYQVAQLSGMTYYDASFVALAKREDAALVTDNPKHQAKHLDVKVIPLKDY
ncbi:MAG TPA: type II toxin-antitoxin system VapC family toxin [Candidatus Nanoarchaeia archaeon]|nr:type II toxin-antitoxin system VapC family toxin [Candidatus Nanoarchaeia archaeon]